MRGGSHKRSHLTPVADEAALPNWVPLKATTPPEAARVRAGEIYRIWGTVQPQPLGDAHRLLDIDVLSNVVLALMARIAREAGRAFPLADASGRYYRFPHWPKLLPALQEWTWGRILDGKLIVTGILAETLMTGNRVPIPTDRLRFLQPDWGAAVLRAEGRAYVRGVMVQLPAAADTGKPRKSVVVRPHVPEDKLQACGNAIKESWPAGTAPPTESELQKLIDAKVGWVKRDRVRTERRRLGWTRERGRPRKNSPQ
jgi:hypothetical protein